MSAKESMRQQVLAVYQERIAEVQQKMNAMGRWRGRGKRLELAHRLSYYERAIERIEGNWRGKGRSGVEFGREGHPYQEDLGILGRDRSLSCWPQRGQRRARNGWRSFCWIR